MARDRQAARTPVSRLEPRPGRPRRSARRRHRRRHPADAVAAARRRRRCCSASPASTSSACCWCGRSRGAASCRCGWRWARRGRASSATSSPKPAVLVAIGAVPGAGRRRRSACGCMVGLIPTDMRATLPFLDGLGINARGRRVRRRRRADRPRHLLARPAAGALGTDVRAGMADGGRGASGHAWRRIGAQARRDRAGDGDGAARRRRPAGPQPVPAAERRARLPAGSSRGGPRRGARACASTSPAPPSGWRVDVERRVAAAARRHRGRADQRAAGQLQRQHDLAPLRRPALRRRAQRSESARRQPRVSRRDRRAAAPPAATSPPPRTRPSRRSR